MKQRIFSFKDAFHIYGQNERMSVSKKRLSWGDTYRLQIAYEEDVLICKAIAIVLDMVLYDGEDKSFLKSC
nr:hypothetical protein [Bacillus halotolerans]